MLIFAGGTAFEDDPTIICIGLRANKLRDG